MAQISQFPLPVLNLVENNNEYELYRNCCRVVWLWDPLVFFTNFAFFLHYCFFWLMGLVFMKHQKKEYLMRRMPLKYELSSILIFLNFSICFYCSKIELLSDNSWMHSLHAFQLSKSFVQFSQKTLMNDRYFFEDDNFLQL